MVSDLRFCSSWGLERVEVQHVHRDSAQEEEEPWLVRGL